VPGLTISPHVPDRIPMEAIIYLAKPPRLVVDVTQDEAHLLRAIGGGISLAELRAVLAGRWLTSQHVLFSLLAHRRITLSRGASVHPDAWQEVFRSIDGDRAAATPGKAGAPTSSGRTMVTPTHAPMVLPIRDPRSWGRS
jgi:hypothetical protein